MCCCLKAYVFIDLWDSILYNCSHIRFNSRFLLPYGIFRMIIIVILFFTTNFFDNFKKKRIKLNFFKLGEKLFLTVVWIISAVAVSKLGQNNGSVESQWFSAMLSISLLAWFLSLLILFLGLLNVTNFPTLAGCHFLLKFAISDLFYGTTMIILGISFLVLASSFTQSTFAYVCGAFALAAFIAFMVSFYWSLYDLYRLRKIKIKILTKCKMEVEENPDFEVPDAPFTIYP